MLLLLAAALQDPGIAARYPGDAGIAKDPRVLFAEDFQTGDLKDLEKRWGNLVKPESMVLEDGTLRIKGNGHLYTRLKGVDRLQARFRVKFHEKMGYLHHFVTLLADAENTPWPRGEAGKQPDGARRFSSGIEPWGQGGKHAPPGAWHFYSYWHEMKPDGRGSYWGNGFEAEQPPIPTDRWICVEAGVKANSTPELSDGEQAFWIDGRRIGEFKGIRWRTSDALKLNAFWLLLYCTDQPARHNGDAEAARRVLEVSFDDVVLATDYIGPVVR
jgi:hypothetical protein